MEGKHVQRVMCSEIVRLHLQLTEGCERELNVNLEEIWPSGALFQSNVPIRALTSAWFVGEGHEFWGQVIARASCQGLGYFVEVQFHPSCVWSEEKYRPQHCFNPAVLLGNEAARHLPMGPCAGSWPATLATAALASAKEPSGQAFGS